MSQKQKNKIIKTETRACDLCGELGRIEAVELLPGGGTLFECHHADGKMHEWATYDGFQDLRNIKTDRENTPEIECPVCHRQGVVKTERDDAKRPDRYSYRISHPDASRCWIKKEHRDAVLKALGRYIPKIENSTTVVQIIDKKKKKREYHERSKLPCPKCTEIGSFHPEMNPPEVIHHYGNSKRPVWHHMSTSKLQKLFWALIPAAENLDHHKQTNAEIMAHIQTAERELGEAKRKMIEKEKYK